MDDPADADESFQGTGHLAGPTCDLISVIPKANAKLCLVGILVGAGFFQ